MVRRAMFQEFTKAPRLLVCQQNVPAPSKVNGAVIVAVTGLHVEPLEVGVRVGVAEGPVVGVAVRVAVAVGVPASTAARAGNHLSAIFWKPALFGWTPSLVSTVVSKPVHRSTTMMGDCAVLKPAAQAGMAALRLITRW